jgi:hypothetical protein
MGQRLKEPAAPAAAAASSSSASHKAKSTLSLDQLMKWIKDNPQPRVKGNAIASASWDKAYLSYLNNMNTTRAQAEQDLYYHLKAKALVYIKAVPPPNIDQLILEDKLHLLDDSSHPQAMAFVKWAKPIRRSPITHVLFSTQTIAEMLVDLQKEPFVIEHFMQWLEANPQPAGFQRQKHVAWTKAYSAYLAKSNTHVVSAERAVLAYLKKGARAIIKANPPPDTEAYYNETEEVDWDIDIENAEHPQAVAFMKWAEQILFSPLTEVDFGAVELEYLIDEIKDEERAEKAKLVSVDYLAWLKAHPEPDFSLPQPTLKDSKEQEAWHKARCAYLATTAQPDDVGADADLEYYLQQLAHDYIKSTPPPSLKDYGGMIKNINESEEPSAVAWVKWAKPIQLSPTTSVRFGLQELENLICSLRPEWKKMSYGSDDTCTACGARDGTKFTRNGPDEVLCDDCLEECEQEDESSESESEGESGDFSVELYTQWLEDNPKPEGKDKDKIKAWEKKRDMYLYTEFRLSANEAEELMYEDQEDKARASASKI